MSLAELAAFKVIESAVNEAELDLVLLDPYNYGYGSIKLKVEARR